MHEMIRKKPRAHSGGAAAAKTDKVTGDDILIVDPASREIVDIITQQEAGQYCKKRRTKRKAATTVGLSEFTRFRAAAASPYFLPPFSLQTFVSPTSLPLLQ